MLPVYTIWSDLSRQREKINYHYGTLRRRIYILQEKLYETEASEPPVCVMVSVPEDPDHLGIYET